MISIKRYLDFPSSEKYQRMLALLAETVTRTPIEIDLDEGERFQSEIAEIQARFTSDTSSQELFVAANSMSAAVERHNRALGRHIRSLENELQSMIGILKQTLRSLASTSEDSVKNLDAIASQLKRASALGDVHELRLRLEECLKHVRDEAERQKQDNQQKVRVLSQGLSSTQQRLSDNGIETDVDGVTGFAGRSTAEAAIREAVTLADTRYVVVAVLSKLQAVNLRFGYTVGDELLCEFAARVAGTLCRDAQFFRWSGPAVIAILKRNQPAHMVQAELSNLLESPIMKSLSGSTQNAFITLSATGVVLPATSPACDIIKRIDNYVVGQTPNDYKEVHVENAASASLR